jgi:hypothetical protein
MSLTQLIYVSRPVGEVTANDIGQILDSSKRNNAESGISGILCFNRGVYLQCLEGSREAVNSTYNRILRDGRHQDTMLLCYQDIVMRNFSQWKMGYVSDSPQLEEVIHRYTTTRGFRPHELSSRAASAFLSDLSEVLTSQE